MLLQLFLDSSAFDDAPCQRLFIIKISSKYITFIIIYQSFLLYRRLLQLMDWPSSSDRHHEIQFTYKRADSEYNPHKISLNINDECLFPRPAMCLLVIVMPYNVFGCKYIAIFLNVHIKRKLSLYKINEDKSRTRQFATMQKNTVTSQSLQRHLTRVTHAPSISCHDLHTRSSLVRGNGRY